MGNVPSQVDKRDSLAYANPVLDMENVPFLRPPLKRQPSSKVNGEILGDPIKAADQPRTPIAPGSLDESPELPPPESISPCSNQTQWKAGPVKWPSYHRTTSPKQGDIDSTTMVTNRSPSSSHSGSSITSQLSFLSRASPPTSRRSVSACAASSAVDASVPPPVPPHLVIRNNKRPDHETESALAAIDSLECEVEEEENSYRRRSRSRSLSRSRSRSLSRPRSLSMSRVQSSTSLDILGTDVYTRKCSYSEPAPSMTTEDSDTDSDDGPLTPDNTFVLDGYTDDTRLRVVNSENFELHAHQYRVKSKALLAEEEEARQRKRYARYGHTFRGVSAHRV